MTDYYHATGTSGQMLIRDTGSTIEFWINSFNSTTYSDHIPWSGTVNGVGVGGSYDYHANSAWNRIAVWGVSTSQNVTFALGNTGTTGFGGPTSFTVSINRATVPPMPNSPMLSSVTSTSLHAGFTHNGDGGSTLLEAEVSYGLDPGYPTTFVSGSGVDITGLTPGATYYFWSRVRNAVGWSVFSYRVTITLTRVPDPPTQPVITDITQVSVVVGFNPGYNGGSTITEHTIGWGTDPDTPQHTSVAVSGKKITGLDPGTVYYIWAKSKNANGYSAWSAKTTIKTVAGASIWVDGVRKDAVPYVKYSGVWRIARPWGKVTGMWRESI